MECFRKVLASSIKRRKKTRSYYETTIPEWTLNGLLDATEAAELIALLDEYYPQ